MAEKQTFRDVVKMGHVAKRQIIFPVAPRCTVFGNIQCFTPNQNGVSLELCSRTAFLCYDDSTGQSPIMIKIDPRSSMLKLVFPIDREVIILDHAISVSGVPLATA